MRPHARQHGMYESRTNFGSAAYQVCMRRLLHCFMSGALPTKTTHPQSYVSTANSVPWNTFSVFLNFGRW